MKRFTFLQKKGTIYICAFLLPFLLSQVFYLLCGIYPYGEGSVLTSDMNLEFVNFYAYFVNLFQSKNDFSYMLAKTIGGDYPGLAAFQLHDPLLFILFFFPKEKIVLGIQILFSLQISVAGLSASVFLNNRFCRSWMSLLFSTAYSFCGFFFGYYVLTIYFGCLAILPLVLYFFLKFIEEDASLIPYTVLTVLYLYINFHMGFMLVIFLMLLYISRVIAKPSLIARWKAFVCSGVVILCLDGFFLIRTGLSLLGEKTTQGADYGIYRRFAMNQVFAQLFSGSSRNTLMPLIYCTVAAVFFSLIYFLSRRIAIREKIANLFLLLSVLISMWINLLDAVWHGFNNPEGFWWRYAYFFSFTIIVLGYQGFLRLFLEQKENGKIRLLSAIAAGMIFLYMGWTALSGNVYMDRERLLLNAGLIAGIFVCMFLCSVKKLPVGIGFALLLLLSMTDMLYNAKTLYICNNGEGSDLPKMESFVEDYRSISQAVSDVKARDGGFYRMEKDFDRAINDPALFDYIGLSHDSSCEKDEILDWLTNFGFCRQVYYAYYNNSGTSFVDSFFGVRYFISRFDSLEKPYTPLSHPGKYYVYENPHALPMAFAAPKSLTVHEFAQGNTFEKQNALAACWGMDAKIYRRADATVTLQDVNEEAPGHYVKTADDGAILYTVNITEAMPLYYYFSAPERQVGELYINGDLIGPYFTENHWNVMCAGTYQPGDTVEIRMRIVSDALTINEPCFYYEDADALLAWSDAAGRYTEGIGSILEITSSHLRFDTALEEEKTVLLTIPYDTGWQIKCDGKPLQGESAMQILLAMKIPPGKHTIEMKYVPHGTLGGAAVSCIGMLLFVLEIILRRKRKKTEENQI